MSNKTPYVDRINVRIKQSIKLDAQEKARSEGYSLSFLIKCFIVGYLNGEIVADSVIKAVNKK